MGSILEDITQALDIWSEKLLDVEIKIKNIDIYRENVINDLQRNVDHGLISAMDKEEMERITNLWVELYRTILFCSIGCEYTTKDIISYLLELFTSKQITREVFVDILSRSCKFND